MSTTHLNPDDPNRHGVEPTTDPVGPDSPVDPDAPQIVDDPDTEGDDTPTNPDTEHP